MVPLSAALAAENPAGVDPWTRAAVVELASGPHRLETLFRAKVAAMAKAELEKPLGDCLHTEIAKIKADLQGVVRALEGLVRGLVESVGDVWRLQVSNDRRYHDEVHGMEQKVALRTQELLKVHEYVKVCSKENSESWAESVKFMNGILDSVNQTHKRIMREGANGAMQDGAAAHQHQS